MHICPRTTLRGVLLLMLLPPPPSTCPGPLPAQDPATPPSVSKEGSLSAQSSGLAGSPPTSGRPVLLLGAQAMCYGAGSAGVGRHPLWPLVTGVLWPALGLGVFGTWLALQVASAQVSTPLRSLPSRPPCLPPSWPLEAGDQLLEMLVSLATSAQGAS